MEQLVARKMAADELLKRSSLALAREAYERLIEEIETMNNEQNNRWYYF